MTLTRLRPGRMNSSKLFALVLIALGIMAFAYQNLPDMNREKSIVPGAVQVTVEKTRLVTPATILGALAFAGGIAVLIIDRSERTA